MADHKHTMYSIYIILGLEFMEFLFMVYIPIIVPYSFSTPICEVELLHFKVYYNSDEAILPLSNPH